VFKSLFFSLVRSSLETSVCVWSPHEAKYKLMLEKVQKAFLRYFYRHVYGYYPFLYPTNFLLGTLGINSLEVRRVRAEILSYEYPPWPRGFPWMCREAHPALCTLPDPRAALWHARSHRSAACMTHLTHSWQTIRILIYLLITWNILCTPPTMYPRLSVIM
jgi:hypothetical protein